MAKNKADRNTSNGSSDQLVNSADQDQPVSSDVAPVEAVNAITMEDFISRQDRADWLSVADAAKHLTEAGATDIDAQKMRNAANNRAEFRAEGAMLKVAVPGYEIRPLTYLHRTAVDLYHTNNTSGNKRAARNVVNGKRWIVRIKVEDREAVIAALAPFGIALEQASAPHKPKASVADAPADAQPETEAANVAYDASDIDNPHASSDNGADWPRTEEFSTAIDA